MMLTHSSLSTGDRDSGWWTEMDGEMAIRGPLPDPQGLRMAFYLKSGSENFLLATLANTHFSANIQASPGAVSLRCGERTSYRVKGKVTKIPRITLPSVTGVFGDRGAERVTNYFIFDQRFDATDIAFQALLPEPTNSSSRVIKPNIIMY